MGILEVIFIGIGLSMDAFAVSVSSGLTMKKILLRNILKLSLCFGLFQAIMPLIGWLAACSFCKYIEMFDGWIALLLLGFIGGKMLYDGLKNDDDDNLNTDYTSLWSLLILGVATSIDALMVGVTFVTSYKGAEIIPPITIIGLTTFLLSASGVFLGKKFGDLLGSKAEIAGGIILILIGLKIFFF